MLSRIGPTLSFIRHVRHTPLTVKQVTRKLKFPHCLTEIGLAWPTVTFSKFSRVPFVLLCPAQIALTNETVNILPLLVLCPAPRRSNVALVPVPLSRRVAPCTLVGNFRATVLLSWQRLPPQVAPRAPSCVIRTLRLTPLPTTGPFVVSVPILVQDSVVLLKLLVSWVGSPSATIRLTNPRPALKSRYTQSLKEDLAMQ